MNDLNNLSSFLSYEGVDKLHVGNGAGMTISHIGSTSLNFSDYTISLHEVLFVPTFTKNLVSLSKLLHDNSLLIEFSSNLCLIKDHHTMRTLLQAKLHRGLYPLSLPLKCNPEVYFGEQVSIDTWHARLGHPSSTTTHKILNSHSLPCNKKKMSLCHHCALAKAHRLPFSSSTSSSTSPLEIVYSDLWGPAPLLSNNGFRYYVVFVDDFSKYSWIYFLRSKDEVDSCLCFLQSPN